MNRNPKEKTVQILIRTKPKDKDKIKRLAEKCNLSISEYMVQRALGYEPRMIPPDTFYALYGKLCEVCNTEGIVPEMETKLLALIDEIHSELLLPNKESIKQIKNGIEVNKKWQPQASGLSKTG
jgi:hypothetical protein